MYGKSAYQLDEFVGMICGSLILFFLFQLKYSNREYNMLVVSLRNTSICVYISKKKYLHLYE